MFIAIVDFTVEPESRAAVIARLLQDSDVIRTMEGNLAFSAYIDPVDDGAVRIWHEWRDVEHFRTYTASEVFKQLGLVLRPLMKAPPISRRMMSEVLETIA
ncbi:putative quinol monooxygenase [Rhizobium leucaenae]|uniref:Quinol monooxygenase YgiN n=1 Tax=Rhizobium leucaenae TaxID=29450 RepID=A0A7W7EML2_9HYPH|nr:antibiotic biosynthesis monooxygenase [Rhizobium leucaenae]MBB4570617.1 quinol monooxygenase YgiN [Rhizobium leucaenae]MBB6304643.1 quinol monooxygenase YgiN [Rhizobium leucaenae]